MRLAPFPESAMERRRRRRRRARRACVAPGSGAVRANGEGSVPVVRPECLAMELCNRVARDVPDPPGRDPSGYG